MFRNNNSNEAPSSSRCSWLKFINTGAVTILSICVGLLFVQLQVITYKVADEQEQISRLRNQVENAQQQQIQQLDQKVEQNSSITILHIAGTFVLATCLLTMFHMSMHLRHLVEPVVQRKILAILWMSPIYSITSFLSLLLPQQLEGYLAVVKDFYEAYVIYTFLSFLIAVLGRGNRQVVVDLLERHVDHLSRPYRFLQYCCGGCIYLPKDNKDEGDDNLENGELQLLRRAKANAILVECQVLTMQFVFMRPLTSIASFIATTIIRRHDVHNDGGTDTPEVHVLNYFASPQFWIAMIQNVSVFFAFAGLVKFYHAVRQELEWCQPFSKFLCIKGVVFMTFWQGLIINIIVSIQAGGRWQGDSDSNTNNEDDPRERAQEIQNVLICAEMLVFAIAHWCTFPVDEWREGYVRKEYEKPGMGFKDFASDISIIMESRRQTKQHKQHKQQEIGGGLGDTVIIEDSADELDVSLT